jgi:D-3-phosphoglycerate dehydrogenase
VEKMINIGVLDTGYKSYSVESKILSDYGYELYIYTGEKDDVKGKMHFAGDKTGLFIRHTNINRQFLDQLPDLKVIIRYGIGYDNIDLQEASAHGVRVANVQGYATHSVSDHAMALMFGCIRAITAGENYMHKSFGTPPREDIFELHDKVLGIIGLGRIGTCFAQKAGALFQNVLAVDPYVRKSHFDRYGVKRTDLFTLLSSCHVISIHCNLTDETFHMIDNQAFEHMKHRPVLINTARGAIINEADLLNALHKGLIHSAGIDVWECEPPAEKQQPVINHPFVISTGHFAWYSEYSSLELQKRAAENMVALLQNKNIPDALN